MSSVKFIKQIGEGQLGKGINQFNLPFGVCLDNRGILVTTDELNSRLKFYNEEGEVIRLLGSKGNKLDQFNRPGDCGFDAKRNQLLVTDYENSRIQILDFVSGLVIGQIFDHLHLQHPVALCVDEKSDHLYVSSKDNKQILVFDLDGPDRKLLRVFGPQILIGGEFETITPRGLFISATNLLYIADISNQRILVLNKQGEFLHQLGGGVSNLFSNPTAVLVDEVANLLYVCDYNANAISCFVNEFQPGAVLLHKFGCSPPSQSNDEPQLFGPVRIAVDKRTGRLFVTSSSSHRILVYLVPEAHQARLTLLLPQKRQQQQQQHSSRGVANQIKDTVVNMISSIKVSSSVGGGAAVGGVHVGGLGGPRAKEEQGHCEQGEGDEEVIVEEDFIFIDISMIT